VKDPARKELSPRWISSSPHGIQLKEIANSPKILKRTAENSITPDCLREETPVLFAADSRSTNRSMMASRIIFFSYLPSFLIFCGSPMDRKTRVCNIVLGRSQQTGEARTTNATEALTNPAKNALPR
jgi:hypothetical protein